MNLPEKEPGFWVALLAWFRSHYPHFCHALLAALFSLLRNARSRYAWSRRFLDTLSCSALAFFAQPVLSTVEVALNVSLPASAPEVLAIYIGYVGTDYIRARIKAFFYTKH
ncbi:MAG: hypothetical protein HamCj_00910 [Candidatus Hamiltonella defensa (Ceratovacuna japonica)]